MTTRPTAAPRADRKCSMALSWVLRWGTLAASAVSLPASAQIAATPPAAVAPGRVAPPPPQADPTAAAPVAPSSVGPSGGRVGAAEVPIVGGNIASARERALAEALRQAVDQVISTIVPDPHVAQRKVVVQVLGRARNYVPRYRALEEGESRRGMYGMRVEAEIDEPALLRAFDRSTIGSTTGGAGSGGPAAPAGSGAPSYLLVGAGAADALEAAARAFATAGARVQIAGADAADPAKALEVAARAGLASVAFVSGSVASEGKVRGVGLEAVTCLIGVRVLTAGAGLPVADESETVRRFADRPEVARAECFQRAAGAAVPRVVPATAARIAPDLRTIVLDTDIIQPGAVPALISHLRGMGAVSAIEIRRIGANRMELWVRTRQAAAVLAAGMSRATTAAITVSDAEVTGDLVRLKVRLSETVTPATALPAPPVAPATPPPPAPAAPPP